MLSGIKEKNMGSHWVKRRYVGLIFLTSSFILFFAAFPTGIRAEASKQQVLVDEAVLSLQNFKADPNMGWFRENLDRAKGLIVFPKLYKGGFILGGSGGRGVLMVQDPGSKNWYGPAFYTIGSLSFGLQIGGQVAEVVMLVMTQEGLENLYSTDVKLGADASVAAGPVGVGASGALAMVTADFVSFARAKGAYAGVSLEGSVIKVNSDYNKAFYGRSVRPVDIVIARHVTNPGASELKREVRDLALGN
jgi:lipid-binding SYLF domain-containing protein